MAKSIAKIDSLAVAGQLCGRCSAYGGSAGGSVTQRVATLLPGARGRLPEAHRQHHRGRAGPKH